MKCVCHLLSSIYLNYNILLTNLTRGQLYGCVYLQKKKLFADLNELLEEIKDVLMHHLNMFDISSVSDIMKIEERVKYEIIYCLLLSWFNIFNP